MDRSRTAGRAAALLGMAAIIAAAAGGSATAQGDLPDVALGEAVAVTTSGGASLHVSVDEIAPLAARLPDDTGTLQAPISDGSLYLAYRVTYRADTGG